HRQHLAAAARVGLHGHHRRLVQQDALPFHVDEGVRRPEVDGQIVREESENGVEKHRAAPRPSIAGPSAGANKLLPETSARGNGNLSRGAGLQTRSASASFATKTRAN